MDNCQFTTKKEEALDSELAGSYSDYISFYCDNKGQHEEIIISKWTIWIPKILLKVGKNVFKEDQRVKIKTISSYAELDSDDFSSDDRITTFDSDIFLKNPITGTWGKNIAGLSDEESDAFIYKVKLTDTELKNNVFYLKWY